MVVSISRVFVVTLTAVRMNKWLQDYNKFNVVIKGENSVATELNRFSRKQMQSHYTWHGCK
jgi:hypothetical protein